MGAAVQPSPGPFYTVLIIYLGVMAFIGWYASRKTSSLGDFSSSAEKQEQSLVVLHIFLHNFLWEHFLEHREQSMELDMRGWQFPYQEQYFV